MLQSQSKPGRLHTRVRADISGNTLAPNNRRPELHHMLSQEPETKSLYHVALDNLSQSLNLEFFPDVFLLDQPKASLCLSEIFLGEAEAECPELTLISSRNWANRGSRVSFAFEQGYAAMWALIGRDVFGGSRAPNVMQFGFTPLYLDETDMRQAVKILSDVLDNRSWERHALTSKSGSGQKFARSDVT